jgi:glycine cleavage system H protein
MNPQDLKYTKTHEWVRPQQGSDVVTVGITEFAVHELGDIVYIELPAVGTKVSQNTPFGVIESAKAAVDLNCPISGQVAEVNKVVTESFDDLANEPYGKGWMIKVKASAPAELAGLLNAAAYEELLKTETHH